MKRLKKIILVLCLFFTAVTIINAQDLSANAKSELAKNNFLPAIDELSAQLNANPNSEAILTYRANFYYRSGQFEKALTDASKALSLNSKNLSVLLVSGSSKVALQKYQESIADFTAALNIQPDLKPALMLRSQAYFKNKEYQKAIADLDTSIKNDPKNLEAYIYRARIAVEQNNFSESISDYTFVKENATQNSKLYETVLVELLATQERYLASERQKVMQEMARSLEPKKDDYVDSLTKQADKYSKEANEVLQRVKPLFLAYTTTVNDFDKRYKALSKEDHKGRTTLYKEINEKVTAIKKNVEKEMLLMKNKEMLNSVSKDLEKTLTAYDVIISKTTPYSARIQEYIVEKAKLQTNVLTKDEKLITAYKTKDNISFAIYKKEALLVLEQLLELNTTTKKDLSKLVSSENGAKNEASINAEIKSINQRLAEIKAMNL